MTAGGREGQGVGGGEGGGIIAGVRVMRCDTIGYDPRQPDLRDRCKLV